MKLTLVYGVLCVYNIEVVSKHAKHNNGKNNNSNGIKKQLKSLKTSKNK